MATIDLGRIKFKWQGAYNGATAYVVDDVVESGGSAYVCIAATTGNTPPNATYWELMSQKGVDADLINISGTVQGDIYYNNGSAIARLGAGTSGQALITNGASANPSWGDVSGGLVQTVYAQSTTPLQQGGTAYTTIVSASITPTSASNSIIIIAQAVGAVANNNAGGTSRDHFYCIAESGTTLVECVQENEFNDGYNRNPISAGMVYKHSPASTSALTYQFRHKGEGGGWDTWWNQNTGGSTIILMEVSA